MPYRKGAVVTKKGNFYIINLIMVREGSSAIYTTPYGTYNRKDEARSRCLSVNKIVVCDKCDHIDDCAVK